MAWTEWEKFADDLLAFMQPMQRIECPFDKQCPHWTKTFGFVVVWPGNAQHQLGQFLKDRFELMKKEEAR